MPAGNPQGYIAEGGVIRLSPLAKAVATNAASATPSKQGTGNGITANRASANPNTTGPDPKLPEGVTEADVAAAVAKAEAGDTSAIDWLKTIGIVAGVGAGGALIYQALKKRGGRGPNAMGADNIAVDTATPNATTAVAKKASKPDLYVDLEANAVKKPAGYLPGPKTAVGPARPAYVQPAIPGQKQLPAAAMRAIRTLP